MEGFRSDERTALAKRYREEVGGISTREVSDLVMSLSSEDSKLRAKAAWGLAEVAANAPDRVPVSDLARALEDADAWVRRGATWALAEVAQADPNAVRPTVERAADLVADDDPLVRENAVVTVAGVAAEHPRDAEPVLAELAELREREDGLAARYAGEALEHAVEALSAVTLDGEPVVVSVRDPRLADGLPEGPTVVQSSGNPNPPLRVGPASEVADAASEARDENAAGRRDAGFAPVRPPTPDEFDSPPRVEAAYDDFEELASLDGGPLTTSRRVQIPAAGSASGGSAPAVATLRTLREKHRADHASRGDRAECDDRVADAFADATRRWSNLDHEHVARVVARGDRPTPWVAVESFDDGTLADHADDGLAASLWYAHRVASAVSYAHALGVVHGGLWPGAVGFTRTLGPTWPVPKVRDWGFPAVTADVRSPPIPAAYAAPEHVASETFGSPGQSTDVYGLGALLYTLLAARPPFSGDPHVVVQRVESETPPAPTECDWTLPDAVDRVVERAMAKRKPERYETVEDLRAALERLAADHTPELMDSI